MTPDQTMAIAADYWRLPLDERARRFHAAERAHGLDSAGILFAVLYVIEVDATVTRSGLRRALENTASLDVDAVLKDMVQAGLLTSKRIGMGFERLYRARSPRSSATLYHRHAPKAVLA